MRTHVEARRIAQGRVGCAYVCVCVEREREREREIAQGRVVCATYAHPLMRVSRHEH